MLPFLKRSLCLPLFPSISHPRLLSHFSVSGGSVAAATGWVKSRTHEILKYFLGTPHQHMLLSSLFHSLFLYLSSFHCYYSSHSWCQSSFYTHLFLSQQVIYILTHSVTWRTKNRSFTLKNSLVPLTIIDFSFT